MSAQDTKAWVSAGMLRGDIRPFLDRYLSRRREYEAALTAFKNEARGYRRFMPPASLPIRDVLLIEEMCAVAEDGRVYISASELHLCRGLSPNMVDAAIAKLTAAADDAREEAARGRAILNIQRRRAKAAKITWGSIAALLIIAATALILRAPPTIVWSATQ